VCGRGGSLFSFFLETLVWFFVSHAEVFLLSDTLNNREHYKGKVVTVLELQSSSPYGSRYTD
jgi:hypothetical protein